MLKKILYTLFSIIYFWLIKSGLVLGIMFSIHLFVTNTGVMALLWFAITLICIVEIVFQLRTTLKIIEKLWQEKEKA